MQLILNALVFNVWFPKGEKEKNEERLKKWGRGGGAEVTAHKIPWRSLSQSVGEACNNGGRWCNSWPSECQHFHSTQNTSLQYLENRVLMPILYLASCIQTLRGSHAWLYALGWGVGDRGAATMLRVEIDWNQL